MGKGQTAQGPTAVAAEAVRAGWPRESVGGVDPGAHTLFGAAAGREAIG